MNKKEPVLTRVLKWAAEKTVPPPEILKKLAEIMQNSAKNSKKQQ